MGCSKGMVLIVLELSQILLWSSSVMSKLPSKLSFRYTLMYCTYKHGHSFRLVVSIFISMYYICNTFSSFYWLFLFWQRHTTSVPEANWKWYVHVYYFSLLVCVYGCWGRRSAGSVACFGFCIILGGNHFLERTKLTVP